MLIRTRCFTFAAAAAAMAMCLNCVFAQKSPDDTVKSFDLADGLEATVWASEPMLVNPTNIDIDSRGRVWVCEGANYRSVVTRPEGDRILILEDTDHDGKADSQKVFVQDVKLKSPLGVCVMGNKVYVSLSPNILVYTMDETGDKPTGPPDVWMTGFEGAEHDHGVHAMVFGPDGRFYFNSGNAGTDVKEPFKWGNGKAVIDSTQSSVPRGPLWRGHEKKKGEMGYMEGMAFRCNADGTGFETLGHNFRNNFELAVDSFGTVWQSDNDDDGNEGVRINYVMEGGNFGYHGPQGHDWVRDADAYPGQTKQQAHWHQKWPGVVPNMLHTGGGSPTGMVVYEGELLPAPFRGALIHCDPGPNVVRAYIPKPSAQVAVKKFNEPNALQGPDREGAGYKADVVNLIKGKDTWFRPSDICVAPDGSLFIADWYDPGVGGHQTADLPKDAPKDWHKLHGRIYRVAAKGNESSVPKIDLSTTDGQIAALRSPSLATRYLAFSALALKLDASHEALVAMMKSDSNPRMRARAMWLLAHGVNPINDLEPGMDDPDVNVRVATLRAARLVNADIATHALEKVQPGLPPAVLRELALAMNYVPAEKAIPMLVKLADLFDGEDRWYLEALGIGANGKEQELLAAWEKDGTNTNAKAGELIRWRLKKELPAAAAAGNDPSSTAASSQNGSTPMLARDGKPLPPIDALARLAGDARAGEKVFARESSAKCISCHQIGTQGKMLGPPLTTIGQKLSKAQLYEAILKPSAGILMGYENWAVKTKKGQIISGLKTAETADGVTIKDTEGKYHDIAAEDIARQVKQKISIMPENLAAGMTQKELVDLVEYLSTLRNKS